LWRAGEADTQPGQASSRRVAGTRRPPVWPADQSVLTWCLRTLMGPAACRQTRRTMRGWSGGRMRRPPPTSASCSSASRRASLPRRVSTPAAGARLPRRGAAKRLHPCRCAEAGALHHPARRARAGLPAACAAWLGAARSAAHVCEAGALGAWYDLRWLTCCSTPALLHAQNWPGAGMVTAYLFEAGALVACMPAAHLPKQAPAEATAPAPRRSGTACWTPMRRSGTRMRSTTSSAASSRRTTRARTACSGARPSLAISHAG